MSSKNIIGYITTALLCSQLFNDLIIMITGVNPTLIPVIIFTKISNVIIFFKITVMIL